MKVQCGQCPAKYAVADERLRDKKVRIHCRRCNASIVVDGKVNPPLVTSTPAHRSVRPLSSVPAPESAPPPSSPDQESHTSPRPVAHTIMGGLEAPVARQLVTEQLQRQETLPLPTRNDGWTPFRPGMPEADRGFTEPPARGEGERWRVALTQQDLRWMSTEEIVEAFRDGAVKSETFVFRAGMPTWVTLLEVTEIAQALADARLVSSPLQAPGALQLVDELAGEEEGEVSPSPQRVSSLPPPRKAARQRGSAISDGEEGGDAANDSEESLPFALVNERANGSKKPEAFADESGDQPMAALDAALKQLEERESSGRAATSNDTTNGAPVREPTAPLPAAALPAAPSPAAAPPQPSAAPVSSPLEPVPDPVAAPSSKSSSAIWIWVVLALLLVGAAAYFLGPRLGLKLP